MICPLRADRLGVGLVGERELDRPGALPVGEDAAAAGGSRERHGIRLPDDRGAVGCVEDAEADPERDVGEHGLADDPGRPLCADDEMETERAPTGGQVDEHGLQFRVERHEGSELVDDDHESRQRPRRHLGDRTRRMEGERLLATPQFGAKTLDRTRGGSGIEVADHADDMRQLAEGGECRTALEVDQEEREIARRIVLGEGEYPGDQEFALSGAGGARDQRVGTIALEIQHDGAIGILPDDGGQDRSGCSALVRKGRQQHLLRHLGRGAPSARPRLSCEFADPDRRLRPADQRRSECADAHRGLHHGWRT